MAKKQSSGSTFYGIKAGDTIGVAMMAQQAPTADGLFCLPMGRELRRSGPIWVNRKEIVFHEQAAWQPSFGDHVQLADGTRLNVLGWNGLWVWVGVGVDDQGPPLTKHRDELTLVRKASPPP